MFLHWFAGHDAGQAQIEGIKVLRTTCTHHEIGIDEGFTALTGPMSSDEFELVEVVAGLGVCFFSEVVGASEAQVIALLTGLRRTGCARIPLLHVILLARVAHFNVFTF